MLALPAPFGADSCSSAHLQLTTLPGFDPELTKTTMQEFGCPLGFAERAVQCLQASSRYDCYLQSSWVKHQHKQAIQHFQQAGVNFHIDHWVDGWKRREAQAM